MFERSVDFAPSFQRFFSLVAKDTRIRINFLYFFLFVPSIVPVNVHVILWHNSIRVGVHSLPYFYRYGICTSRHVTTGFNQQFWFRSLYLNYFYVKRIYLLFYFLFFFICAVQSVLGCWSWSRKQNKNNVWSDKRKKYGSIFNI